jgi:hypothetical protein
MTTTIPHYTYDVTFTKHGETRTIQVITGSRNKTEVADTVATTYGIPTAGIKVKEARP